MAPPCPSNCMHALWYNGISKPSRSSFLKTGLSQDIKQYLLVIPYSMFTFFFIMILTTFSFTFGHENGEAEESCILKSWYVVPAYVPQLFAYRILFGVLWPFL